MFKNHNMLINKKNVLSRVFVVNRKQTVCKILISTFIVVAFTLLYFLYLGLGEEAELKGWERNVSRNASLYVNPSRDTSFSHADPNICSVMKPLVVLIVLSDARQPRPRQAIRETWAKDAHRYNILVLFLVGISPDEQTNMNTLQESIDHKDIILEEVHEAYHNLTLKSILMLKWVHKRCMQARFLFKADDDSYINLANFHNYTKNVPENELENFLVGRVWDQLTPHRDRNSKWYVPRYIFSQDFPPFVLGIGYLMSTQLAEKLYFQSLQTSIVNIEDAYVTGICARKINVIAKEDPLFYHSWSRMPMKCNTTESRLIVVEHGVDVERMYEIYRELSKC